MVPVALMGTFALLQVLGFSIKVLTMFGMALVELRELQGLTNALEMLDVPRSVLAAQQAALQTQAQ